MHSPRRQDNHGSCSTATNAISRDENATTATAATAATAAAATGISRLLILCIRITVLVFGHQNRAGCKPIGDIADKIVRMPIVGTQQLCRLAV